MHSIWHPHEKNVFLFLLSHQVRLTVCKTEATLYHLNEILIKWPVERWWYSHRQGTFPKDFQSDVARWPRSVVSATCAFAPPHPPTPTPLYSNLSAASSLTVISETQKLQEETESLSVERNSCWNSREATQTRVNANKPANSQTNMEKLSGAFQWCCSVNASIYSTIKVWAGLHQIPAV